MNQFFSGEDEITRIVLDGTDRLIGGCQSGRQQAFWPGPG